jgi:hypothetical protein
VGGNLDLWKGRWGSRWEGNGVRTGDGFYRSGGLIIGHAFIDETADVLTYSRFLISIKPFCIGELIIPVEEVVQCQ